MEIVKILWALNVIGFIAHIKWCDKDPTHEDVVISASLIFCFVPGMVFAITALELVTQKIFHIHHGVKRK